MNQGLYTNCVETKPLIIFGAGGHAKVILDIIQQLSGIKSNLVFVEDNPPTKYFEGFIH
jgi:hypothetical protein